MRSNRGLSVPFFVALLMQQGKIGQVAHHLSAAALLVAARVPCWLVVV